MEGKPCQHFGFTYSPVQERDRERDRERATRERERKRGRERERDRKSENCRNDVPSKPNGLLMCSESGSVGSISSRAKQKRFKV